MDLTLVEKTLADLAQKGGKALGENIIGPAIAAGLNSAETRAAVRRTVFEAATIASAVGVAAYLIVRAFK